MDLQSKQRDTDNDPVFQQAIEDINSDETPSLGKYEIVNKLLRFHAASYLEEWNAQSTPEELAEAGIQGGAAIAKALLGQDKNYSPVPGWNQPGSVDKFIAQAIQCEELDPRDRIATFYIGLLSELVDLAIYASEPGVLPEQWQWQVVGAFDHATKLALGQDPQEEAQHDEEESQPSLDPNQQAQEQRTQEQANGLESVNPAALTRTQESMLRAWDEYP